MGKVCSIKRLNQKLYDTVDTVARKIFYAQSFPNAQFEDLVSIGSLTYLETIKQKNFKLKTATAYLFIRVKGSMLDYIRKQARYSTRERTFSRISKNYSCEFEVELEQYLLRENLGQYHSKSPEEIMLLKEAIEALKAEIKKLPKRERSIIVSRYFKDKPLYKCSSEKLGKSALSKIHKKALKQLRKALDAKFCKEEVLSLVA